MSHDTFATAVPQWPAEPDTGGKPNVAVIVVDDLGWSDIGPYGSEIPTPHLDALAERGVQMINYHTLALCSPARAALLTGVNPHRAGFAFPANSDPGFPAWSFQLPAELPTVAEILQQAGYATFAVGKWHLAGDRWLHDGASKASWPLQRGFDRYFGSLEGFTSLHHPHRLIWDNSPYPVDSFDDDHYLTDALTDRAEEMIRTLRSSDDRTPWFLWFAHHAVHGPVQARDDDLAAQRGRYAAGWDRVRQERFDRQRRTGIFDEDVALPETADGVQPWDELPPDLQQRHARYMEAYAAAVSAVDRSVGRLVDLLTELGELDNTIIVFTSDNGATAEGGRNGTRSYLSHFAHVPGLAELPAWPRDVERDVDAIGGPESHVHYPSGWGRVSNTPFRRWKGETYGGGIRAPFLISWPARLPQGERRRQFLHATDLTPTLLELAEVGHPGQRHGQPAPSLDGHSAVTLLFDAGAPAPHGDQYTESQGLRAFQRGRWKIIGLPEAESVLTVTWQLYDLDTDPTETTDLAELHPEVVAELAEAWEAAARANQVYPLPDRSPAALRRRPADALDTTPVRLSRWRGIVERWRSARLIQHRDADLVCHGSWQPGDRGVLVAHGDQGGGYLVAIDPDGARIVLNAYGEVHLSEPLPLTPGPFSLRLQLRPRPGFSWDLVLLDEHSRAQVELLGLPRLLGFAPFTGISIGADRGGPVQADRHRERRHDPYLGELTEVIIEPGPPAADHPEEIARRWAETKDAR